MCQFRNTFVIKALVTDKIQLQIVLASEKCGKDKVAGGSIYELSVQGLAFGTKSREMKQAQNEMRW